LRAAVTTTTIIAITNTTVNARRHLHWPQPASQADEWHGPCLTDVPVTAANTAMSLLAAVRL